MASRRWPDLLGGLLITLSAGITAVAVVMAAGWLAVQRDLILACLFAALAVGTAGATCIGVAMVRDEWRRGG